MKRYNLAGFVFKSACFFVFFKICSFKIHLFSILNTKETNHGIFSNMAGENFILDKIFLDVRVRFYEQI